MDELECMQDSRRMSTQRLLCTSSNHNSCCWTDLSLGFPGGWGGAKVQNSALQCSSVERPISTLQLLCWEAIHGERCSIPKDGVWSLATGQLRSNWGQSTARVCLCCSKGPTRVVSWTISQFTAMGAMGSPLSPSHVAKPNKKHPSVQHDVRQLYPSNPNRLQPIASRPSKPSTSPRLKKRFRARCP